uniref:SMB domain-containing protein n=1 Tax=Electrophorus electricus TaxID=8005 RepID=A0AAY5EH24_ELEEL
MVQSLWSFANFSLAFLSFLIFSFLIDEGLFLALHDFSPPPVPVSCHNRCYEPYDYETPGCRCNEQCISNNNCCYDFQEICLQPAESWECTLLRCGEKRVAGSKCQCSEDCLHAGDCCTNYNIVCCGVTPWVQDDCVNMTSPKCPANFKRQPLLLISLDGLRAEYQYTWHSLIPVLNKLRKCGTSSIFMQPVFPSKTFPNHYSIVTGLYTESHGLVDNNMYDPIFDASFSLSNSEKDNPRWYLGTIPFEQRVFTVLKWLQLPDDHAIQGVDKVIGQLMNGLKQLNLHECVNIIVVADHGMEETSCERKEVLEDLVGDVSQLYVTEGVFGRIRARNKTITCKYNLTHTYTHMPIHMHTLFHPPTPGCKKSDQKVKAYLKSHLPKRFHYANSRRIDDVNVLVTTRWLFERYPGSLSFCTAGNHGYDNDEPTMQVCACVYGPKFYSQTVVEPFSNIELYNLMCDVLEITPAQNNGSHGSLNHMLRSPPYSPEHPVEQSSPGNCPMHSLEPSDQMGCSCPALVPTLPPSLCSNQCLHFLQGDTNPNARLNLTDTEGNNIFTYNDYSFIEFIYGKHLLFGRPRVLQSSINYCILHHHGYISAYSRHMLMPLWSSFTVEKTAGGIPGSLPTVTADCLRADVRIPAEQSPTCDQYNSSNNITHAFLYPPSRHPTHTHTLRLWQYFQDFLLLKYSSQYNRINVVAGPAFDYNSDGHYDTPDQIQEFVPGTRIPIPTHYFTVLTSCLDVTHPVHECDDELHTVSFLVPHRPTTSESCLSNQEESYWVEDLIWFHQSRVQDVEWITGLDFFQSSIRPLPEILRVKTRPTNHTYCEN